MADTIVDVREVTKTYRLGVTQVHALRGVSLRVEAGGSLAVMGPSGSGKSTLMHLIGCLDRPTTGEVEIQGTSTAKAGEKRLARLRGTAVGFVFQSFYLIPRISALANVMLPMTFAGVIPKAQRARRAVELLERVGLGGRIRHMPHELSGGELQRVAIARALANDPPLLLADEPTGNLDTQTGRSIMALFEELHREGRTVIVVTHDPEIAAHMERVIHLVDGQIQKDGGHDMNGRAYEPA